MFSKEKDRKYKRLLIVIFLWLIVTSAAFLLSYDYSIKNVGFTPVQPVIFNHKVHSGDFGIKCIYCHFSAERSNFSALPTTWSCMVCHVALKNESERMRAVNKSFDDSISILWNRVYILPGFVHFSHSRHLSAFIDCSSCHGEVEKMDTVKQVTALTMGWCLDCHRNPEKFIIGPKEITGLFTGNVVQSAQIKLANTRNTVYPAFGMYEKRNILNSLSYYPVPGLSGPGPENCSSCHY